MGGVEEDRDVGREGFEGVLGNTGRGVVGRGSDTVDNTEFDVVGVDEEVTGVVFSSVERDEECKVGEGDGEDKVMGAVVMGSLSRRHVLGEGEVTVATGASTSSIGRSKVGEVEGDGTLESGISDRVVYIEVSGEDVIFVSGSPSGRGRVREEA